MFKAFMSILDSINAFLAALPEWLVSLVARIALFRVFWLSAQTKITGWTVADQHFAFWNVTDNVFFQFWEYPAPISSNFAIYAGTAAEFFFSIMIILGLFTRYAALGLLAVTAVIQIVVPEAWWSVHIFWVVLCIYLIKHGGGCISLDRFIFK